VRAYWITASTESSRAPFQCSSKIPQQRSIALYAARVVQPLTVVDKSNNAPSRLTFPLDGPYSTFSEGNSPSCSCANKENAP